VLRRFVLVLEISIRVVTARLTFQQCGWKMTLASCRVLRAKKLPFGRVLAQLKGRLGSGQKPFDVGVMTDKNQKGNHTGGHRYCYGAGGEPDRYRQSGCGAE
jgi:hypothetical protein